MGWRGTEASDRRNASKVSYVLVVVVDVVAAVVDALVAGDRSWLKWNFEVTNPLPEQMNEGENGEKVNIFSFYTG